MSRRGLAAAVLAAGMAITGCGGAAPADVPQPQSSDVRGPELFPAASAYVDAVARRDLDALAAAFAPDGVVVDVQRRIEGRDAIREWAAREVIGGSLRVDAVTALGPDVQRVRVHWAPSGSAGWAADYTFRVGGGEIVEADLQYAR
jgi:ketosteroid isomerase-like protein